MERQEQKRTGGGGVKGAQGKDLSFCTIPVETITRFELIEDGYGRLYVNNACRIEISIQDEGRTMKVFISDRISSTSKEDLAAKVLEHRVA